MIGVTYRTFSKEDCKEVIDFWANAPSVRLRKNGEDTIEGITAYLERNPGTSFVAVRDGAIIGAILCGHDGRRGYIYHLAVESSCRRSGIGKKLLRLALEQLKTNNIKKSAVFILRENNIGETFYKSLLWKEENRVKVFAKII